MSALKLASAASAQALKATSTFNKFKTALTSTKTPETKDRIGMIIAFIFAGISFIFFIVEAYLGQKKSDDDEEAGRNRRIVSGLGITNAILGVIFGILVGILVHNMNCFVKNAPSPV